jgi:hypothetical protein
LIPGSLTRIALSIDPPKLLQVTCTKMIRPIFFRDHSTDHFSKKQAQNFLPPSCFHCSISIAMVGFTAVCGHGAAAGLGYSQGCTCGLRKFQRWIYYSPGTIARILQSYITFFKRGPADPSQQYKRVSNSIQDPQPRWILTIFKLKFGGGNLFSPAMSSTIEGNNSVGSLLMLKKVTP